MSDPTIQQEAVPPTHAAEPGHVPDEAEHVTGEPFDEELPTVDATAPSALAAPQALAGSDQEVECPQCHTRWKGNDLGPHAAWFCEQCQFPLFWANAAARPVATTSIGESLSRLPGTQGRLTSTAIDCPACGEHNPSSNCWRCNQSLNFLDPPPAPPAPPPPMAVAPAVIVAPQRPVWPWILATGLLALTVVVLVLMLLLDD